jgi:hypothetical protein
MLGKSFEAEHFAARPARPATDGMTRIVHRSLRHGSVNQWKFSSHYSPEALLLCPRSLSTDAICSNLGCKGEHRRSEMIRVPSLGIMHYLMHRKVRVVEINVCKSVVSMLG